MLMMLHVLPSSDRPGESTACQAFTRERPSKVFFHNIPLKGHAGCSREHIKASAFADAVARLRLLPPVKFTPQTSACERLLWLQRKSQPGHPGSHLLPGSAVIPVAHSHLEDSERYFERVTDQVDRPGPIHSQADQEAGALLNPKATPADLNVDCCFLFHDVLFHREAGAGCNLLTSLLGAIWFLYSSRGPHKGWWKARLSCRVGPGPSCLSSSQRRSLVPTQGKISEKAELCLATFCWVVLSTGICCLERRLFIF